eukprot:Colp12_sorted_trinity150504_noHs@16377
MAFKFGFDEEEDVMSSKEDVPIVPEVKARDAKVVNFSEAVKHLDKESLPTEEIFFCNNTYSLKKKNISTIELEIKEDTEAGEVVQAVSTNSDLVPGVYEGGFKVWECSIDLVEYLLESKTELTGKNVAEVGCGAGLPGLVALKGGATVLFQDYNNEVLTHVTCVNSLLNTTHEEQARAHYLAGDWARVSDHLAETTGPNHYDIILTSETIYSLVSIPKLYDFLKRNLKRGGFALVAAKTHYFGVGGGTRDFEDVVRGDGVF